MSLDWTNDWMFFDNLISAVYYQRTGETTYGAPVNCTMMRYPHQQEYMTGGLESRVRTHENTFIAFNTSFESSITPTQLDKFSVDGVFWEVMAVDTDEELAESELRARKMDDN